MTDPMKLVTGEIDISTWAADASPLEQTAFSLVNETIKAAFEDYGPDVHLPFMWASGDNPSDGYGGPPKHDPLTLYVSVPLGPNDMDSPIWETSLREIARDFVEALIPGGTGIGSNNLAADDKLHAKKFSDALRKLADDVERWSDGKL